jgi:hypothetical protein
MSSLHEREHQPWQKTIGRGSSDHQPLLRQLVRR